jgi:hypothetical protein
VDETLNSDSARPVAAADWEGALCKGIGPRGQALVSLIFRPQFWADLEAALPASLRKRPRKSRAVGTIGLICKPTHRYAAAGKSLK